MTSQSGHTSSHPHLLISETNERASGSSVGVVLDYRYIGRRDPETCDCQSGQEG